MPQEMDKQMEVQKSSRRKNESFLRQKREANLNAENAQIVRRMQEIHLRKWDQGHVGGELRVPAPSHIVRSQKNK